MRLPDLNLTLQLLGFRVLALLIIAGVHGGIVATSAVLLGDKGPRHDGRLTIAPAGHIDLVGAFSLIIFGLGWTKPIEIDARQFRIGRIGVFVVILAGFVGLLLTAGLLNALVLPALTTLPYTAGLATAAFLRSASSLSIWCALLSLVPMPPLAGGLILDTFGLRVPRKLLWILTAALFIAVATGMARRLLGPAHAMLGTIILGG